MPWSSAASATSKVMVIAPIRPGISPWSIVTCFAAASTDWTTPSARVTRRLLGAAGAERERRSSATRTAAADALHLDRSSRAHVGCACGRARAFHSAKSAGYTSSSSTNERDQSADHRRGDALHHVGAGAAAPEQRQQARRSSRAPSSAWAGCGARRPRRSPRPGPRQSRMRPSRRVRAVGETSDRAASRPRSRRRARPAR